MPLLAKLLLLPQARTADEADLFVVPWFASTELAASHKQWTPSSPRFRVKLERLLPQLTHFTRAPRRHLFLSSRDPAFTLRALKALVNRTGAMLAHYGPRTPKAPQNEIVLAPNSAGFGAPLAPLPPARNFLFAMMDESLNKHRRQAGAGLRELNRTAAALSIQQPVRYYQIGNHRSISLPPRRAAKMMRESLLCPIVQVSRVGRPRVGDVAGDAALPVPPACPVRAAEPPALAAWPAQGDLPYQHRIYDALAAGCVPLMFEYPGAVGGKPCSVWSWDPRTRDYTRRPMFEQGRGAQRACFACVEHALPFPSTLDWSSIIATVPGSVLHAGDSSPAEMARAIASLDRGALEAKRRALEAVGIAKPPVASLT